MAVKPEKNHKYYCNARIFFLLTVQSPIKLFKLFKIIRLRKLMLNADYEINNCQIMIFRLYIVYNEQDEEKN